MTEIPMPDAERIDAAVFGLGCAIRRGGKVSGWPSDAFGNADGRLDTGDNAWPVGRTHELVGMDDAVSVGVGTRHVCLGRRNGKVLCWGDNPSDAVGVETLSGSTVPVAVPW